MVVVTKSDRHFKTCPHCGQIGPADKYQYHLIWTCPGKPLKIAQEDN